MSDIQLGPQGQLRHLLTIDGMERPMIEKLLLTADSFLRGSQKVRSVPLLRGRTIAMLFFEASTRTRTAFELAAKRLSADLLHVDVARSALVKGEGLLDMLRNIIAMQCRVLVVRHGDAGAARFIANQVDGDASVINAGDGCHSHPTQALVDAYAIQRLKGDLARLKIAIVGDILHSRVARSQIQIFHTLGVADLRLVGPSTLVPPEVRVLGGRCINSLDEGLDGVDVVIALRLQKERMESGLLSGNSEFHREYGLTEKRLEHAAPDAIVLHPGPINRGVELDDAVADGARSAILRQVEWGVAVRMAAISLIAGNAPSGPLSGPLGVDEA